MIDHIKVGGPWIEIATSGGTIPYIPSSPNPMQGAVRVINGQQEVWNGTTWMIMYGDSATLRLSKHAEAIMAWAANKMAQEQRLHELAKTNPTVADAMDAYLKAEDQLKMVLILTEQSR